MEGNFPIAAINYVHLPDGTPVVIQGRRHTWNGEPSSPGMPPGILKGYGDPDWSNKLGIMLEDMPRPIFYLTCHHSGEIKHLLDEQYPKIGSSIMAIPGDAIITPKATKRSKTLVAGGADCMFCALYDGQKYAVAHFSVLNEFGWKNPKFEEPVSVRIFREMDPTSSIVVVGPTIGPCCYDWGADDKQELVDRMIQLKLEADPESLFQERSNCPEKVGFDFRRAMIERLGKLGAKVCVRQAVCTCCNNTLYHSRRFEGTADPRRLRNIIALPIIRAS